MVQLNLGRARAAHDLAYANAMKNKVDIMMISEPNKKICSQKGWYADGRRDVAIKIVNKNVEIEEVKGYEGYIHMRIDGKHIYLVYISPNIKIADFKKRVDKVFEEAAKHPLDSIVAGDINAKSQLWGAPNTDNRGEYVEEWLSQMAWTANNNGQNTFERGRSRSHIDVTLSSEKMARLIHDWRVNFDNPFTQHGEISFNIKIQKKIKNSEQVEIYLNKEVFMKNLREMEGEEEEDVYVGLLEAFRRSSKKNTRETQKKPYWWNEKIEQWRNRVIEMRRKYTRRRSRGQAEGEGESGEVELKEAIKNMKREIRFAKKEAWKAMLVGLEEDIWGEGYRIVTGQLMRGRHGGVIPVRKRKRILNDLFPKCRRKQATETIPEQAPEQFTGKELEEAVKRMKSGKSPGLDGFTVEALKIACSTIPGKILDYMNKLLKMQEFPKVWKEARVVLLPKEGKDPNLSSSYRPICLINTMAKLYERMIVTRLEKELEEREALSERQHGFRQKKSTVTAMMELRDKVAKSTSRWCLLITVDIRNAFNTARWENIIESMNEMGVSGYLVRCVESYFKDRIVRAGVVAHRCHMGVPQGSIKGPILWNIMYDGILRQKYGPKVTALAYADDLMMIVEGGEEKEVINRAEKALTQAAQWMRRRGLKIAPQKTEVLVAKGPKSVKSFGIMVEGVKIDAKPQLRYLGVVFRKDLSFSHHIDHIVEKALAKSAALGRIMPNIGGPAYYKRRLLSGVVHSVLLYAAPVWRDEIKKANQLRKMVAIQRKSLLRVASAYRTVSAEAVQVVAGFPPIDLMVAERCFLYKVGGRLAGNRRMARERTLKKWQERWERTEGKAQWTKKLIHEISPWIKCKHKSTSYFFTQFLTGHGSFSTFTHKIGKRADDQCHQCHSQDSPEHAFYECKRWKRERKKLVEAIGILPEVKELIPRMLGSKEYWDAVFHYVIEVMKRKEEEDRENEG